MPWTIRGGAPTRRSVRRPSMPGRYRWSRARGRQRGSTLTGPGTNTPMTHPPEPRASLAIPALVAAAVALVFAIFLGPLLVVVVGITAGLLGGSGGGGTPTPRPPGRHDAA